jgi:hypothetical protein
VEYRDTQVLTDYVWEHFSHLMTEFEQRVGRAILWRQKAANQTGRAAEILNERWGKVGDPEIDAALTDGPEAFRRGVCARLLVEAGDQLFINRCPRCHRIVRTPKAKQCFWCGHDWHSAANSAP